MNMLTPATASTYLAAEGLLLASKLIHFVELSSGYD
jgi:hypothetical protein